MKPAIAIIAGLFLVFGFPPMPTLPSFDWPAIVSPVAAVDRVVYVYELRDSGAAPVPSAVRAGMNRLNLETKVVADFYEVNPSEEVKPVYRVPLQAAQEAGLPALVVMGGDKVVRVVRAPATADDVWRAAQ